MAIKIQTIGIITKHTIVQREMAFIKKTINILVKAQKNVLLDEHIQTVLGSKKGLTKEAIMLKSDLVIIIGGDGTIIKSAAYTSIKAPLILAVNMGNRGFFTEIKADQLEDALQKIFQNQFTVDKRELLEIIHYRKNKKIGQYLVLNEALIGQNLPLRLIEFSLKLASDTQDHLSCKADGLIIATPSGSTAHSLSAGGSIVHPNLKAILITPLTPLNPHTRPLVISGEQTLTVSMSVPKMETHELGLVLDGHTTLPLQLEDHLKIAIAKNTFPLIRFKPNFYLNLKEKMHWGV